MSRFVWNGALYGNLEEDPEPPAEKRVQLREPILYRWDCPHCTWFFSYLPERGDVPLLALRAIELHLNEHVRAAIVEFTAELPAPSKPAIAAPKVKQLRKNKDGVYE